MKFSELALHQSILQSLKDIGFEEMTDIQEQTIPAILEGKDLIGQSMTGSGKTAAFGVPIIQHCRPEKKVQALILEPTRELAEQVTVELKKFAKHSHVFVTSIYGGVSMEPQIQNLRHTDIVVGTPGRILDHLRNHTLSLAHVHILTLDEADRMLDMGFIDDINKIISQVPQHRQTLLFSATMPDEIKRLAHRYMKNPVHIKTQIHIEKSRLSHIYYDVKPFVKNQFMIHLLQKENPELAIVFCATRTRTHSLAITLQHAGLRAKAIHGGLSQAQRMHTLESFHNKHYNIMIATDVAARGLDFKNISHIINYDVPKTPEDYTHRIGRTAREGKSGIAITLVAQQDHDAFRKIIQKVDIEKAVMDDFVPKREPFHEQPQQYGGRRSYGSERRPRRRY
ncbi:MAG: DEAD/DEAH box helicase [Candidatus Aenigmarchaeota archaeon]|nr:DEAD/DEAH box helicase [Candidatus Aenigmarchaeota archaeon]